MVLERYGDEVIDAVTSPVTGIQRTCKFPPSIAEVVEFIDEHVRRAGFAANYDLKSGEQLRERERIERENSNESAEHRRAVVARLWPRALEGTGPKREIKDDLGFRRFTDDELRAAYGKVTR